MIIITKLVAQTKVFLTAFGNLFSIYMADKYALGSVAKLYPVQSFN